MSARRKQMKHKRKGRPGIPDGQPNGWDERDYKLWSKIRGLPSYGLIAPDDVMISLNQVLQLLDDAAEARFDAEWKRRTR